jgi:hypothetical protein
VDLFFLKLGSRFLSSRMYTSLLFTILSRDLAQAAKNLLSFNMTQNYTAFNCGFPSFGQWPGRARFPKLLGFKTVLDFQIMLQKNFLPLRYFSIIQLFSFPIPTKQKPQSFDKSVLLTMSLLQSVKENSHILERNYSKGMWQKKKYNHHY